MRYASGIAIGLSMALAPIAAAQDCTPITRVIASAPSGYQSLLGEEIGDAEFEAESVFAGGMCGVDAITQQYSCHWEAATPADADKVILPLYDMAKVCLSEKWSWQDIAGTATRSGLTVVEGQAITKNAGMWQGTVVRLYMGEVPGKPARHVRIEVRPK